MRLPLIAFTPKSLLRHPMAHSKLDELASGTFKEIIDDETANPKLVTKVIFVSGRLYYDLAQRKIENQMDDIAIVRIEQLYPIPEKKMNEVLKRYKNSKELVWVQDEPENMGAWPFINRKLAHFGFKLISRKESASPAVGLMDKHKKELETILGSVFKMKEVVEVK